MSQPPPASSIGLLWPWCARSAALRPGCRTAELAHRDHERLFQQPTLFKVATSVMIR
ncbi:MAG: hypothetical protein U0792_21390 [Gemmataceae bacterium]